MWNSKTALATVHELFWGMLGRGDDGLRGIGVSKRRCYEVLALEVLNVVDCFERKRRVVLPASASALHAVTLALSFPACLRVCICTCFTCVRVCVYVCLCTDMHVCTYMHVNVYMYVYACVYMCICTCIHILCISCESQYQCLSVVGGVMNVLVCSCT